MHMTASDVAYNGKVEGDVIVTRADAVINWIRQHSVWPMPMGQMITLKALQHFTEVALQTTKKVLSMQP
mgnify:CR=1 FL=1